MTRRVVITGVGAVTPLGNSAEESWEAMMEGKSGIGLLEKVDREQFQVKVAGEVRHFDIEQYVSRKEARKMDLFVHYALASSIMAMNDAALSITEQNAERVGVWMGTGIGGLGVYEEEIEKFQKRGPSRISPFFVTKMIPNMASGQISIYHGAKGPNGSTVTACASGTHSVGDAFEIIRRGDADAMITGGAESPITNMAIAGFQASRALSTNPDPNTASRPFDKNRDGFVIGEGAGALVLEEYEHAKARGAKMYAEIVGYGATADAFHITAPAPGGEGDARAMNLALKQANITPDQVDYINAHGTSTPLNDLYETAAIKSVFGEHAYKLAVSSTKSMTGHLLGGAGGIETVFVAQALKEQIAPPTIGYETQDEECDLDYVTEGARLMKMRYALSNSLGFGGHNAALLLKAID